MQYEKYLGLPSFVEKEKKLALITLRKGCGENYKDGKRNYSLKQLEKS